jgi:hypothetical protein
MGGQNLKSGRARLGVSNVLQGWKEMNTVILKKFLINTNV